MEREEDLFRAFLASLDDEQRYQALAVWWWAARPSPWGEAVNPLAWGAVDDAHLHLTRSYAVWLDQHGSPRGAMVRLLHERSTARARRLARQPPSASAWPDPATEAAFRRDIAEHAIDPTPWLVLADWLDEQADPRADEVRACAGVRALEPLLPIDWLEMLGLPMPPRLPRGWFERCTPELRACFQVASREANRFRHDYLGSQHLLLGTVAHLNPHGNRRGWPHLDLLSYHVEQLNPPGPDPGGVTRAPVSPRVRQMLAQVCANPIEDQDAQFFLALCCSRPAAGVRVLENAGYSLEMVCRAVHRDLHQDADEWLHWHPEVW